MMINPTRPTLQQVREIRGRDSYTAKLVVAPTNFAVYESQPRISRICCIVGTVGLIII